MQNKFKIAFVFSVIIIVCWLSILTCYAQEKRKDQRPHDEVFIDNMGRKQNESANELKLNSTEIIREEMPDNDDQNRDGSYLRSDGVQIYENYTPAQEKRKDQKPYGEVLIDTMERRQNESTNVLKLNSTEIIREEMPDNDEQNSDGSYLRSDGEEIYENYTPAQEKPIIHHKEQEKNKLPASEPNLNKD